MSSEIIKLDDLQSLKPEEKENCHQIIQEVENSIFLMPELEAGQVICTTEDGEVEENQKEIDIELPGSGDGSEAIYSCNSCGVSFLSVLDHIQQFHSDQEVVVEMEPDAGSEGLFMEDMNDAELIPMFKGDETVDQDDREEGEVIEGEMAEIEVEPEEETLAVLSKTKPSRNWKTLHEQQCVDSDGRAYTRKVVQIEKFWEPKLEVAEISDKPEENKAHLEEEVRLQENGKDPIISRVYHCVKCLNQYDSIQEFEAHSCVPGTKKVDYKCEYCNVTYNNSKSLCAHMKVHKGIKKVSPRKVTDNQTTSSYKCDVCGTSFPTNKSLRLHSRMHYPVKQRPIEAPVEYDKSNTKRLIAKEDPLDENISGDKFYCLLCEKWMHIGYKKVHEMTFHVGLEQYNCEICNRKFFTQENLEMHFTVHNSEKVVVNKSDHPLPYECSYCNRQFSRPHEKVKHERIHTGEKPHVCEICGKSFRVSYCLTLHMRTHTGARPYECSHCGKRFKAHSVYNHHLLTHSNVRAYKCPYCPKSFKTSVQLAGHKNAHTKPFSCTECNRPFASLYAVRVHMATHKRQNNLKFNCDLCGASYARAFALKDHIKSQHLNSVPQQQTEKGLYLPEVAAATLSIIPKDECESIEVMDVVVEEIEQNEEIKMNSDSSVKSEGS